MSFLTEAERSELKKLDRVDRDRKVAGRKKAILLSGSGRSVRKISEALLLEEDVIGQHIAEYNSTR